MIDFRENRRHLYTKKDNTVMSGIIVVQVIILMIQIWLMYGILNNVLDNNRLPWSAFAGSVLLFIINLFLIKYLPDFRKK